MAKVTFSEEELIMMHDSKLMPAKQNILNKAAWQFEQLANIFNQSLAEQGISQVECKTSRGENLQGQPYMVVDIPQIKSDQQMCHLRLLFWWGHHVRSTIFLSDMRHNKKISTCIQDNFSTWLMTSQEDIWHFDETRMAPMSAESLAIVLNDDKKIRFDQLLPLNSIQTPTSYYPIIHSFKELYLTYYGIN